MSERSFTYFFKWGRRYLSTPFLPPRMEDRKQYTSLGVELNVEQQNKKDN